MGLGIESTAFLEHVKTLGVKFDRTAMLGRQNIHTGGYAEDYLRSLGAYGVTSFDYSDYENAEHLHDFNLPIPDRWRNKFSVVLDGGTLEHVFNYPQAIANAMSMVEVGGHLLLMTPANGYCGHGFYQFSPDLFYRVLGSENGFRVRLMFLCRAGTTEWQEIEDRKSSSVNGTTWESLLLVMAEKTREVNWLTSPQQGGYESMWEGHKHA